LSKKVLIMCTGNSCRSIIAEALINSKLDGIVAKSCGSNPSGKVNENAIKVLKSNNYWSDAYYSKDLNDVVDTNFDLVVTVCSNAKSSCPIFPKEIKTIHVEFKDPDGKEYSEFIKTFNEIKERLLPIVKNELLG